MILGDVRSSPPPFHPLDAVLCVFFMDQSNYTYTQSLTCIFYEWLRLIFFDSSSFVHRLVGDLWIRWSAAHIISKTSKLWKIFITVLVVGAEYLYAINHQVRKHGKITIIIYIMSAPCAEEEMRLSRKRVWHIRDAHTHTHNRATHMCMLRRWCAISFGVPW